MAAHEHSRTQVAGLEAKGRLAWADVAKGASILLVVLHHVLGKHYYPTDWQVDSPAESVWFRIGLVLQPIRMPVFFLLSGFFAASVLRRPWRAVAERAFRSYYLYVVWLAIYFVVLFGLGPGNTVTAGEIGALEGAARLEAFLVAMVEPATALWYVYALAAYVLLAKAVQRRTLPFALTVAVGLAVADDAGWLPLDDRASSVAGSAVYFLAGACLPRAVSRLVAAVTVPRTVALWLALVACVFGLRLATDSTLPGAPFVLSLGGIAAGVSAATVAVRLEVVRRIGTYVGRNTLPIFLLHIPLIAGVQQVVDHLGSPFGTGPLAVVAHAAYPVVLSLVITVVSLAVHRWVLARWAAWLLAVPRRRRPPAAERIDGAGGADVVESRPAIA